MNKHIKDFCENFYCESYFTSNAYLPLFCKASEFAYTTYLLKLRVQLDNEEDDYVCEELRKEYDTFMKKRRQLRYPPSATDLDAEIPIPASVTFIKQHSWRSLSPLDAFLLVSSNATPDSFFPLVFGQGYAPYTRRHPDFTCQELFRLLTISATHSNKLLILLGCFYRYNPVISFDEFSKWYKALADSSSIDFGFYFFYQFASHFLSHMTEEPCQELLREWCETYFRTDCKWLRSQTELTAFALADYCEWDITSMLSLMLIATVFPTPICYDTTWDRLCDFIVDALDVKYHLLLAQDEFYIFNDLYGLASSQLDEDDVEELFLLDEAADVMDYFEDTGIHISWFLMDLLGGLTKATAFTLDYKDSVGKNPPASPVTLLFQILFRRSFAKSHTILGLMLCPTNFPLEPIDKKMYSRGVEWLARHTTKPLPATSSTSETKLLAANEQLQKQVASLTTQKDALQKEVARLQAENNQELKQTIRSFTEKETAWKEERARLSAQVDALTILLRDAEALASKEQAIQSLLPSLSSRKLCIIGGNQNWIKKMRYRFPVWTFIEPNLGKKTIDTCLHAEYTFFFYETLGHGDYYAYVSALRKQHRPFGYIHGVNEDQLLRQIAIQLLEQTV